MSIETAKSLDGIRTTYFYLLQY